MNYLTDELIKPNSNYRNISQLGILPQISKTLLSRGNPYSKIRELKNDSHVWSCIQSRKSGTLTLDSFLDANECSTETVEFIKNILNSIDMNKFVDELLDAPLMGFQVHDIIWKYSGENNQYLVPGKLVSRPQEYFGVDEHGDIMYKASLDDEYRKIPEYKFLITGSLNYNENPLSNSLLAKCYWNVIFKNTAVKFWVNYTEKYGFPLIIGQYNRGASQHEIQSLGEALQKMTDDTVLVTPMDIDLELKEAKRSSSAELYKELIHFCNSEISKTLLSETLTTEMRSGSYAAAQTHYRIRREVAAADSSLVESSINRLIAYTIKLNFDSDKYPKFKFVINDSDNLNKIDRDIQLNKAGVKFSKSYIMRTYGLSESDFDI